jgi:hypothetical protein
MKQSLKLDEKGTYGLGKSRTLVSVFKTGSRKCSKPIDRT